MKTKDVKTERREDGKTKDVKTERRKTENMKTIKSIIYFYHSFVVYPSPVSTSYVYTSYIFNQYEVRK